MGKQIDYTENTFLNRIRDIFGYKTKDKNRVVDAFEGTKGYKILEEVLYKTTPIKLDKIKVNYNWVEIDTSPCIIYSPRLTENGLVVRTRHLRKLNKLCETGRKEEAREWAKLLIKRAEEHAKYVDFMSSSYSRLIIFTEYDTNLF
jgi:hypothetical protein